MFYFLRKLILGNAMHYARWIRYASLLGLVISLFVSASNTYFVLEAPRDWGTLDLTAESTTYFTFAGSLAGRCVGLIALAFDSAGHALFWGSLWNLGRRLRGTVADATLAPAFRQLALAFGGFVLLRGLAIATLLAGFGAFGGRSHYALTIGNTGLLLGGLAGLIAWCVARLLAQAAAVAAENSGFV